MMLQQCPTKWFIFLLSMPCSISQFFCPDATELNSTTRLTCNYYQVSRASYLKLGGSILGYCDETECKTYNDGYRVNAVSTNESYLEILNVNRTAEGDWVCQTDGIVNKCSLVLIKTPTCHITSGNDTNNLDIHENISLSVNVTNYYCSTSIDFLLKTGQTEEDLLKNHTVKEKTSGVFNSSFNVTESHIGSMGLIFICNDVRKTVGCGGVQTLKKRPPMCNITADGDTGNLNVGDVLTMSLYIEDYFCSGDLDFFLQTGGESDRHNLTGIYNETITLKIKQSHFGPVSLYMNCNDVRRKLDCGGIQGLSKGHSSIDDSQMAAIIGGTIGALVFIIVLVVIILYIMRKQNVKLPKLKPACVKA